MSDDVHEFGLMAGITGIAADQARRARAQQLNQSLDAMVLMQHQLARQGMTTTVATNTAALDAVPDLVDREKEFIARNLVQQAQSDYAAAVARGQMAEAARIKAERDAINAESITRAAIARADEAERKLLKLQPEIRKKLISPLFAPAPARVQYELKWPWFATSWALLIAGIVVCAL